MTSYATRFGTLLLLLALTGCASVPHNSVDPLERFNRSMFIFNDKFDQVAAKPAAKAYKSLLPSFVQTGIGNFFGNIGDVWTAVNNLLQGNVPEGLSDVMRVAVNSTLGLGGVLDIGSEAGMAKHNEDFGQTLGKWGVKSGPYVVLPFLGSSTVRDSLALPLDFKGDPWNGTTPVNVRNVGSVVRVIDQRAVLLDASNLIEEAAIDRYEFVRDAYLQRRQSKVHNGETPPRKPKSSSLNQEATPDEAPQPSSVSSPAAEPASQSAVEIAPHKPEAAISSLPNTASMAKMPVPFNSNAEQLVSRAE